MKLATLFALSLALLPLHASAEAGAAPVRRVPLIYCTDLFHPHEDPDDHFDLATVYSIPEFDLRGIVLDQGARQRLQPGRIPVSQLNHLSGRSIPVFEGLATPLVSSGDTGTNQPAEFQGGVRFILDTLRAATGRVDFIAVGSVRDLCAAFNRDPDLFRQRAGRVMIFIGEASHPDVREYNVGLDPHAFVGLMRSGLNLCWVPCFDGGLWRNNGHASFWRATHADLLSAAPPELIQFFIYALEKETGDPIEFLRQPVDPKRREALFRHTRNLWCTAIFRGLLVEGAPAGDAFVFDPVDVTIRDDAAVRYGPGPDAKSVLRFRVRDQARYDADMTAATAAILARFPVAPR
ncbi:MAG: nucleoside hydrolase [Verrucomicrobia bacterium]|nr:nucleoside hydrolase [Verrucomicrobiota bacterium]